MTWHGIEHSRNAVVDLCLRAPFHFSAIGIRAATALQARVIDELRDEQIQLPVIVEVEPHRACGPSRRTDSASQGYIGEGPVAAVVIQDTFLVAGEQQVLVAITVVVGTATPIPKKFAFRPASA